MEETAEVITEALPNYQPKTLAAIKMLNTGVDPYTALQLVNNKDKVARSSVCSLKKKANKWSLTHPSVVKAANNQVKRILSGEAREIDQQKVTKDGQVVDYKEVIAPSDTNILAAASLVYDRYEPQVKQVVNINLDVDPVDLSAYLNRAV